MSFLLVFFFSVSSAGVEQQPCAVRRVNWETKFLEKDEASTKALGRMQENLERLDCAWKDKEGAAMGREERAPRRATFSR